MTCNNEHPAKIAFLSIVTLGFYELMWLHRMTVDMSVQLKEKPLNPMPIFIAQALALIGVSLLLHASWVMVTQGFNNSVDISANCWSQHIINLQGGQEVTQSCQAQLDAYEAGSRKQSLLLKELTGAFLVGILYNWLAGKWLVRFSTKLGQATEGKLSDTFTAFTLMTMPFGIGAALVQRQLNVLAAKASA